jgi:hypothetical protein
MHNDTASNYTTLIREEAKTHSVTGRDIMPHPATTRVSCMRWERCPTDAGVVHVFLLQCNIPTTS